MRSGAILQSHMPEILQFKRLLIAQPEQWVEPPKTGLGVEGRQRVFISDAIVVLQVIVAIALKKYNKHCVLYMVILHSILKKKL